MIESWISGILYAIGIGIVIAPITSWIGGKRLSNISGPVVIYALCTAYYLIALFCMRTPRIPALGIHDPILSPLLKTVMLPFGYAYKGYNPAFFISLAILIIFAGTIGSVLYWIIRKRKLLRTRRCRLSAPKRASSLNANVGRI